MNTVNTIYSTYYKRPYTTQYWSPIVYVTKPLWLISQYNFPIKSDCNQSPKHLPIIDTFNWHTRRQHHRLSMSHNSPLLIHCSALSSPYYARNIRLAYNMIDYNQRQRTSTRWLITGGSSMGRHKVSRGGPNCRRPLIIADLNLC